MKKIASVFIALALVFSFSMAYAADARVPQSLQAQYAAETGAQASFYIWFPVAPELASYAWTNILILSNFNNNPITVGCWFTSLSRVQTYKTFELGKFEKMIAGLPSLVGNADDVYDIFCMSSNMFGAALLLMEGGNISTAWPPVVFY